MTIFPVLKRLHCSIVYLQSTNALQLEELYLMWSTRRETGRFGTYARQRQFHSILNRLKVFDIYSHVGHESYDISDTKTMSVDDWIPYLTSLRVIIFPRVWGCINKFVDALFRDPHICPALTTITSLEYPASWISLCNSLEIRNHLDRKSVV